MRSAGSFRRRGDYGKDVRPPELEVAGCPAQGVIAGLPEAADHAGTEIVTSLIQVDESARVQLVGGKSDPVDEGVLYDSAVKDEQHPVAVAPQVRKPVDDQQAIQRPVVAQFLPEFADTALARTLALLDDPAGYLPRRLVGRMDQQHVAVGVSEQGSGADEPHEGHDGRVLILVLADTHLRAGLDKLPSVVKDEVGRADIVLHAGDITSELAYEEFAALAPEFHAVLGNNDRELAGRLPVHLELELDGVKIGLVHDSGPQRGRAPRLRRLFPDCDVVVFGHSHAPCNEPGEDQLLFNPGSPTQRRRQPCASYGLLEIASSRLVSSRIVPLLEGH